jgi:hypothetical protein
MLGIAAHAGNPLTVGFDDDPAADAAITTGGWYFSHGSTLATDVPVRYLL